VGPLAGMLGLGCAGRALAGMLGRSAGLGCALSRGLSSVSAQELFSGSRLLSC
ncbi:hypothetical protein NDU88_007404, partial [Pleurodeles waltl]